MNLFNLLIQPDGLFNSGAFPTVAPLSGGKDSAGFGQLLMQLLAGTPEALAELQGLQGGDTGNPSVLSDILADGAIDMGKSMPYAGISNGEIPTTTVLSDNEQVLPIPSAPKPTFVDHEYELLMRASRAAESETSGESGEKLLSTHAAALKLPAEQLLESERAVPATDRELAEQFNLRDTRAPANEVDQPHNTLSLLETMQKPGPDVAEESTRHQYAVTMDGNPAVGLTDEAAVPVRSAAEQVETDKPILPRGLVSKEQASVKGENLPKSGPTDFVRSNLFSTIEPKSGQLAASNQRAGDFFASATHAVERADQPTSPARVAVAGNQQASNPMARAGEPAQTVLPPSTVTVEKLVVESAPETSAQQAATALAKEHAKKPIADLPRVKPLVVTEGEKSQARPVEQATSQSPAPKPATSVQQPKLFVASTQGETFAKANPVDATIADKGTKSADVPVFKDAPVQPTQTTDVKAPTPTPTQPDKPAAAGRVPFIIDNEIPTPPIKERAVLQIRLVPDSLGAVKMHLQTVDNQLTARVIVQSDAARAMVEHNFGDLQRSLADAGLVIEKFEVAVAQAAENMRPDPDANPQRRRGQYKFKANRRYKTIAGLDGGDKGIGQTAQMPASYGAGSLNLVA